MEGQGQRGLGFRVQDLGGLVFRGLGFRGLGFWGFEILGFRVWGLGSMAFLGF